MKNVGLTPDHEEKFLRKRGNTPERWFPGGTERSVTYGRYQRSSREEEGDPPPEGGDATVKSSASSFLSVRGAA
jgi:hypothetical protein